MTELFENATKKKLRFNVGGSITTEDLWDLPLLSKNGHDLDDLWKKLSKEAKASAEESLIVKVNKKNIVLELKLAVVKRIIEVKMAWAEARTMRLERKAQKERIMALIADKEHSEDAGKSKEDLLKMLDELDVSDEE